MKSNPEVLENDFVFDHLGQELVLSVHKSLFWREEEMLIISDLHFGKAGHFRKNGIPIPTQIHISDFQKINYLIDIYHPKTILFLGDLFHSDQNEEWNDFRHWSGYHHQIDQLLVMGNHDVLKAESYADTAMDTITQLEAGPFLFTHETVESERYNIAGHIHPAIRLRGLARQGTTLPCFYFGKRHALMPAFGSFTGNHPIKPKKGEQVFAIADDVLVRLMA